MLINVINLERYIRLNSNPSYTTNQFLLTVLDKEYSEKWKI